MLLTEQPAWLRARAGFCTASRFADVMAFGKSGQPLKARNDYLGEIVAERLSGEPVSSALSSAMGWGADVEPYAKAAYEIATGAVVLPCEFVRHPTLAWVGATPDGLLGEDGGYESKCPANSLVHLTCWLDGMPKEHLPQVQGCLWVTGRNWWEFISYDPRMPAHLRLYRQRIERDDAYIAAIEAQVARFLKDVDAFLGRLAFIGVTGLPRAA